MAFTPQPLYFGCVVTTGHRVCDRNLRTMSRRDFRMADILSSLDGMLCVRDAGQPEGVALLHQINGWTLLAFWDRSVDSRMNSNSVFAFPCELSAKEAVEFAKKNFPTIWERFTFPVQVVSRFVP